ncbi:MAG: hypothetical protein A3K10_11025 [Bacteroidetes bacterium RIFCSPLOWO2_12_FULL_31_6]|nr:MAG: hypothetical protein A3K10_11025 [Bacteroidetes bacterium RIFCSPLOWO2_12_FULL_31_6]
MGIRNRYTATLILVIAVINFGCFQYKDVEILGVSKLNVKEISAKAIDVEVEIQINNPNRFDISLEDAELVLFIKSKKIGLATINEKIVLLKKSNDIHRFTIQTNIKELSSETIPLLLGLLTKSTIEFGVQGTINAKAKGVIKKIPIDFKNNIKL